MRVSRSSRRCERSVLGSGGPRLCTVNRGSALDRTHCVGKETPPAGEGGDAAASLLFINKTQPVLFLSLLPQLQNGLGSPSSECVADGLNRLPRAGPPPSHLPFPPCGCLGWRAGRVNPSGPAEQSRIPTPPPFEDLALLPSGLVRVTCSGRVATL